MIQLQKELKHALTDQLDGHQPNLVFQVDLPVIWKQIKTHVEPANKKVLKRVGTLLQDEIEDDALVPKTEVAQPADEGSNDFDYGNEDDEGLLKQVKEVGADAKKLVDKEEDFDYGEENDDEDEKQE